ncbi:hypothetical protein [Ancylobacter lacus]|uniref:hypothetical protein n=1 Tax=Ancylobacter lacus TaxID=2579970 RepID=UPI001BCF6D00|nr:hypothetical protein [Ancylobacter lacus]MBS7537396.1 hypothetical protein [Ancylobacter lacus]
MDEQPKIRKTLASHFNEAIGRSLNEKEEKQKRDTVELLLEMQSKAYDKAATYTTIVMAGGYAGAFTAWSNTSEHLNAKTNAYIGISLVFSLAIFIFFEIYKMIINGITLHRNMRLLSNNNLTPSEFLQKLQLNQKIDSKISIMFLWTWFVILFLSIISALFAVGIMFWNYMALITKWPAWPA